MIERWAVSRQEVVAPRRVPLVLISGLLDSAHEKLGADGPSDVAHLFFEENKFSYPFPQEYSALVLGDNPFKFRVVAYEDHRGYPPITDPLHPEQKANYRCVVLATSDSRRAKSAADSYKELKYETTDEETLLKITEGFNGGHIRRNHVVDGRITDFPPSTFVQPQGRLEARYSIGTSGELSLVYEDTEMVGDFKILTPNGEVGGRWTRYLMTNADSSDQGESDLSPNLWYEDEYLLQGLRKVRGEVAVKVWGDVDKPQKMIIRIGSLGKYEDFHSWVIFANGKLKVVITKEGEAQLDFLRTDPNFGFLFEHKQFDRVSLSDAQRFVKNRVSQLHSDWTREKEYAAGEANHISREYSILTKPFTSRLA